MAAQGGGGGGGGGSAGAIRAGRAFVELFTEDKKLHSGLDKAANALKKFGSRVALDGLGVVGAGMAVLTPLAGLFKEMIDHFSEVNDAADRLSTTPEIISALGYAAEQSGASMEDVEKATKSLYQSIDASGRPAKSLAEEYKDLATELDGIDDPAQRSARALDVLGKNGLKLLPMLKGGGEELQKLFDRAAEVGDIVSSDDAAKADRAGDAFVDVQKSILNTLRAIPRAMLPYIEAIEALADKIVDGLGAVRAFILANGIVIIGVAAAAAGVVALGAAIVGLGTVIASAGLVLNAMMAVLGFLATPAGILVGVLAGLTGAVAYLLTTTDSGNEVLDQFSAKWAEIGETFQLTWGGILDALSAGELELAGQIAMAGLKVLFLQGTASLRRIWDEFLHHFTDGWKSAISEINSLVADMVERTQGGLLEKVDKRNKAIAELLGDPTPEKAMDKFRRGLSSGVLGAAVPESEALKAAMKELADARQKLNDLVGDAAVAAAFGGGGKAKDRLAEAITPGLARGLFNTGGFGAQAFGGNTLAEKQVGLLGGIKDGIDKIVARGPWLFS